MNYLALIMSLIALGFSLSQILLDPNVSESTDGFCHQLVIKDKKEICVNDSAVTATDSGGVTKQLCVAPYLANKCAD